MFSSGLLRQVERLVTDVVPVSDAADSDLLEAVKTVEAARRWIDSVQIAVVGELHARGTTDIVDGLSTRRWIARETGVSNHTASRLVGVSQRVRVDLPATAAAMADGCIGFDHANVLSNAVNPRILAEFAQFEAELVAMAQTMMFEPWKNHVRTLAALLDQDGAYDPDTDITRNKLMVRPCTDGTDLSGTLIGDTALQVQHALEHVTAELLAKYRADAETTGCDIPPTPTIRALALAELCTRALHNPNTNTNTNTGSAAGTNTGTESNTGVGWRSPRVEATLILHATDPGIVYDTNNISHRYRALGPLLCDTWITPIVINSLGNPVDIGRTQRFYTTEQRKALAARDGGCVFPGCNATPQHCVAHHVDHWINGGNTDTGRGVLLCRHHHGVIHRTGWNINLNTNSRAIITTPDHRQLWGQQHHQTPPPSTPPPGTEPPTTRPPATGSPGTGPPGTEPPATGPPGTAPPNHRAASTTAPPQSPCHQTTAPPQAVSFAGS